MANTAYYSGHDNPDPTNSNGSDAANTSICPNGWRLPLGDTRVSMNLSFSKLDYQMGGSGATANTNTNPTGADRSKVWRSFPNNFLYAGTANGKMTYYRGTYGIYWSSSAYNAITANRAYIGELISYPGTNADGKQFGNSVRCVLAP